MAASSAARTKRNYTEKDLFLKFEIIEKKLEDLTKAVRQLADRIDEKKPPKKEYVYGIKGLSRLLDCSIATAQRIKSSGVINGAIIQRNRRIIIDAQKALELFNDPFSKWGIGRGKKS